MKSIHHFATLSLLILTSFGIAGSAHGATMNLEQKYQDVFVSAGYATAMGAAVGAAILVFQEDPTDHLRYVALGASIGFFAGTAFGTYVAVAPAFASNHEGTVPGRPDYLAAGASERQLILQPVLHSNTWRLNGLEAGMILAKF
ncbi:MAG: hypothetical protein NTV34_08415 [Proteobacteria bacterium]|nr:hypothetical protein [Pseudomonadota bacterium]